MKFVSPAKCILSGEHSVLRGGRAIAFPVRNSTLGMLITEQDDFELNFSGSLADEVRMPFWLAMEKALSEIGKERKDLYAKLDIENTIPLGSGLGASASLCVAVAKLFIYYGWLEESQAFDFSKTLEDVFHGESSGLDVAVSLNNMGILFHREEGSTVLDKDWSANLHLTYSGNRGLTSDCIKKVKTFIKSEPKLAKEVDIKMNQSVDLILKAIEQNTGSSLQEGLNLGHECFQEWGLVNANMREHMQRLKAQGAIAMKPTGSGDGGFILSLWPDGTKPLDKDAISVF